MLGLIDACTDPALRAGRLVPVLAGWRAPDLPVWAVTPRRDTEPAKLRVRDRGDEIAFPPAAVPTFLRKDQLDERFSSDRLHYRSSGGFK